MPTFGGASILGQDIRMRTSIAEPAVQRQGFFGLSGVFQIHGGGRGRKTTAAGMLVGATTADLSSAFDTLNSYADGIARDLVDTNGVTWTNVVMDTAEQAGERRYDATNSVYCQPYQAMFTHLV